MKLERSKNTKRNIFIGIVNKLITIFLPFAVQTVFIRTLGAEYLGLRGVFSSVLQVLNLAELGFGSAMVFHMYDAIAADNDELICSLMELYRKIYRYIGLIILLLSFVIVPFIPRIIRGEYPGDINIYVIYGMYIANTVLSYWLFAYKNSLLNAFQRQDIIGIINTIVQFTINLAQIIYLITTKNFYIYLSLQIVSTILSNLIISIVVDKLYPHYKCMGKVPAEIISHTKKKIAGLMIYRLCGVTRNSFDNIFVSMFLGLVLVGMYNNYYYIITNVMGLLSVITSAMLAGVGNSIASETKQKNYSDLKKIDFLYMLLSGWCAVCMLCLYQPFMKIWAGEELVFPFPVAVLFTIYFYIMCMGNIRGVYADAAGLWWENRYRTVLEVIANIILNYTFVKMWGAYGIILATIITLLILGYAGSAMVLFGNYFHFGLKDYFISHFIYILVTMTVSIITLVICSLVRGDDRWVLLIRIVICCTITPLLYYVVYCRTKCFKESRQWLKLRLKKY